MKHFKTPVAIFLLVILSVSCNRKAKEPYEVTYDVKICTAWPYQVCIMYKDSTRKITAIYRDSNWTQKVTLPPGVTASLTVYPFPELHPNFEYEELRSIFETPEPDVIATIAHPNLTITGRSNNIVMLAMLHREVIEAGMSFWERINPFSPSSYQLKDGD